MELFKEQTLLEFTERFKTDLDCEEYLASLKWEDGYGCRLLALKKAKWLLEIKESGAKWLKKGIYK